MVIQTLLRRSLIVVGCGPHYQEKYHPVLEEKGILLSLLIDLESRKEAINSFFCKQKLQPERSIFLREKHRNTITPSLIHSIVPSGVKADGMLLCTEPKAKKAYVIWALERRLPVFMDKPFTAFNSQNESNRIWNDFDEMVTLSKRKKVEVVVSCERRTHPGYLFVMDYLQKLMQEVSVPITGIDIQFAGGIWNLPHEYLHQEHHPFKYGYGVLLHSGYHYLDLLTNLLTLNDNLILSQKAQHRLELLYSQPKDQILALANARHFQFARETRNDRSISEQPAYWDDHFGETDVILIGQGRVGQRVVTNYALKLFGTSISLRKNANTKPKVEGKIRQEIVTIHLGTLCSIHISSLPLKKIDSTLFPTEHFEVTIMNSPCLPGYEPVLRLNRHTIPEHFGRPTPTTSLNEYARKQQLIEFLEEKAGNSSLESHTETARFLSKIFARIRGSKQAFTFELAEKTNPLSTAFSFK